MSYLKNQFEKISNYPEDKRRQILVFSTTGITLFIIVLWLLNIWLIKNEPVPDLNDKNSRANFKEEVSKIGSGINLLKQTVKDQF
ncbi:MAG: hypothetical protein QG665_469 [Patescibacteria group bacterium]|nr:hypothetical protein [Patescibacteria group bacterium]